jgi:opacity protein-like surface antigen
MPRVSEKATWIAGLATAALIAVPAMASAQEADGAMRLSGAVRFAADLPSVQLTAPALTFDEAELSVIEEAVADPVQSEPLEADQTGTASAIAWYERFTIAPSESHAVWGVRQREFQLQGGDRWGVTFGYSESDRLPQDFSLDDISAGAFYDFSERFRFGGQLRFTSPEEEIFGEDTERKEPELRFESAFRF